MNAMKLKFPLLIASLSILPILQGCEQQPDATTLTAPLQIAFSPIETSASPLHEIRSSQSVTINGQQQPLSYQTLFATGDKNNGEYFGSIKDVNGKPVKFADGSKYICSGTNEGVGSGLDHISILKKNNKLFMVSQYECAIGALYMNELEQTQNGQLKVKANSLKFIDQSSEFGGFVHCAGQTTPWQSHLSSEEYEPDARTIEAQFDPVTGLTGINYYDELRFYWQGDLARANPYFYGWIPEVQIDARDSPVYSKHYSMGRFSHELAYVMPDQKTVYMSDDGTNGGFYLYIADKPQDLSSGHLYAAKWIQTSGKGLGEAIINWADLGHTDDASIRKWVGKKLNFSNLFATADRDNNEQCPSGFQSVNTMHGSECLKLKDINGDGNISRTDEIIAARLETRRMAAYLGATTEFRKAEGITFNPQQNKLYLSISEVARGMENFNKNGEAEKKYDLGGHNDIQLNYNRCGGVYQLQIEANPEMRSDYVAHKISGLIAGIPQDDNQNSCSLDGLANPDNISFLPESNSLIIGEDSSHHQNNLVWSFNTETSKLTPVFSTPTDAEATSPFWHKDINGYGYLTVVTQHPLKNEQVETHKKASHAGIIGPFKWESK